MAFFYPSDSQLTGLEKKMDQNGFSKRELCETQFIQSASNNGFFLKFTKYWTCSFVYSHSCTSDTSYIYDKRLSTHEFLLLFRDRTL